MAQLSPNAFAVVQQNVNPLIVRVLGGLVGSGSAAPVSVAAADITLAASSTTSIWYDAVAAAISSGTSGFPNASVFPIASVVTNAIRVTSITDARPDLFTAEASAGTANVQLVGQAANIATTNLQASAPAGLYRLHYYLVIQTAVTAGYVLTFGWTDKQQAQTLASATSGTAAGSFIQGSIVVQQQAAGNITYAAAGTIGTGTFAVYCWLERVL